MSTAPPSGVSAGLLGGRYRVGELIARGGMASVHRGRDERLDRVVALKIMHPHLADDDAFRRRFSREARSVARLAHRNVVGVFDQGEDDGSLYLAMELVEGRTLRADLVRGGALTVRRALETAAAILRALAAAHAAGIIHRDIKPENILLSEDGEVKVADFGLARVIGAATASNTGTLLGTVAYVSPEVVTRGLCDERSDLYSLGILLYEMLTGMQPFRGEQAVHVAFQHVHEDVPAPSARTATVPPPVDALVTWLAARRPASRPASAEDALRSALELLETLPAEVLDAPPETTEQANTGEVPQLTAEVDLEAPAAPPRSFLARVRSSLHGEDDHEGADDAAEPTDGAAAPEGSADSSVVRPAARVPDGRHLHQIDRRRSAAAPLMALLAVLALLLAGGGLTWRWYAFDGPGGDRTVPSVAGMPLEDAESALAGQQLAARTEIRYDDTVPEGSVVSSEPAAGTEVKRADEILLVVSRGVQTFPVPEVVGTPRAEAERTITEAGFTMVEDEAEYSETVPAGTVISQSADAADLPAGAEVHVVLSQGRRPIDVPSTIGLSRGEAQATLEEAGFQVSTTEANSPTAPAGTIAAQTPAGGTLFRGDEVQLVVSRGPEMVAVPNVVDKTEAEAVAALQQAGFSAKVTYSSTDGPRLGRVLSQSVTGGNQAAKGSTVTITIV